MGCNFLGGGGGLRVYCGRFLRISLKTIVLLISNIFVRADMLGVLRLENEEKTLRKGEKSAIAVSGQISTSHLFQIL